MHLSDYADEVLMWNAEAGHLKSAEEFDNNAEYRELALKLIEEEVAELREAVQDGDEVDFYELLDAVADILFTLFGLTSKAGVNHYIEAVLAEVIKSNNSKLFGERVVLPNGKIGKPEGYEPPDIRAAVEKVNEALA